MIEHLSAEPIDQREFDAYSKSDAERSNRFYAEAVAFLRSAQPIAREKRPCNPFAFFIDVSNEARIFPPDVCADVCTEREYVQFAESVRAAIEGGTHNAYAMYHRYAIGSLFEAWKLGAAEMAQFFPRYTIDFSDAVDTGSGIAPMNCRAVFDTEIYTQNEYRCIPLYLQAAVMRVLKDVPCISAADVQAVLEHPCTNVTAADVALFLFHVVSMIHDGAINPAVHTPTHPTSNPPCSPFFGQPEVPAATLRDIAMRCIALRDDYLATHAVAHVPLRTFMLEMLAPLVDDQRHAHAVLAYAAGSVALAGLLATSPPTFSMYAAQMTHRDAAPHCSLDPAVLQIVMQGCIKCHGSTPVFAADNVLLSLAHARALYTLDAITHFVAAHELLRAATGGRIMLETPAYAMLRVAARAAAHETYQAETRIATAENTDPDKQEAISLIKKEWVERRKHAQPESAVLDTLQRPGSAHTEHRATCKSLVFPFQGGHVKDRTASFVVFAEILLSRLATVSTTLLQCAGFCGTAALGIEDALGLGDPADDFRFVDRIDHIQLSEMVRCSPPNTTSRRTSIYESAPVPTAAPTPAPTPIDFSGMVFESCAAPAPPKPFDSTRYEHNSLQLTAGESTKISLRRHQTHADARTSRRDSYVSDTRRSSVLSDTDSEEAIRDLRMLHTNEAIVVLNLPRFAQRLTEKEFVSVFGYETEASSPAPAPAPAHPAVRNGVFKPDFDFVSFDAAARLAMRLAHLLAPDTAGVYFQGMAELQAYMTVANYSPEAIALEKNVHQTLYHGALTEMVLLAKKARRPQPTEPYPLLFNEFDDIARTAPCIQTIHAVMKAHDMPYVYAKPAMVCQISRHHTTNFNRLQLFLDKHGVAAPLFVCPPSASRPGAALMENLSPGISPAVLAAWLGADSSESAAAAAGTDPGWFARTHIGRQALARCGPANGPAHDVYTAAARAAYAAFRTHTMQFTSIAVQAAWTDSRHIAHIYMHADDVTEYFTCTSMYALCAGATAVATHVYTC